MLRTVVLLLAVGLVAPSVAEADPILFTKRGPGVSALFEISGNTLKITLRKTGDTPGARRDAPVNPADALPSVFFDLPAGISLTPLARENGGLAAGEVVYTMSIAGGTLSEADISNVSFQYGTGPGDPKLPGGMLPPKQIPEPAVLLLMASGLGLAVRRARRGKAAC